MAKPQDQQSLPEAHAPTDSPATTTPLPPHDLATGEVPPQPTELAPRQPDPTTDLVKVASEPNRAISAFSSGDAFTTAQRMAKALASSSLMPKDYQNNIPNTLIAIELASRIGCSVLMVAQNLDIIHGRPSWRATFLIARSTRAAGSARFGFAGKATNRTIPGDAGPSRRTARPAKTASAR